MGYQSSRLILSGLFIAISLCRYAYGDYAWIPKYDKFFVRLGGEFYRTGENYLYDGSRQDLVVDGELAQISTYKFFIEPEYGFADNWSAYLRANYQYSSLDSVLIQQPSLLYGNGMGDIYGGLKWNVVEHEPTLTLEAQFKIPTYSYYPDTPSSLALGNGDFSIEGKMHFGYRLPNFFFSLAPGVIGRFYGYAPAFTFLGAAGFTFSPAYLVLTSSFFYSLTDRLFLDSSILVHDALGSGGSYALLSGSPSWFDAGLKVGMCFTQNYFLEAQIKQSFWGRRAGSFFDFTLAFFARFDFFKPDPRKKVKEIPLDAPADTYWEGE